MYGHYKGPNCLSPLWRATEDLGSHPNSIQALSLECSLVSKAEGLGTQNPNLHAKWGCKLHQFEGTFVKSMDCFWRHWRLSLHDNCATRPIQISSSIIWSEETMNIWSLFCTLTHIKITLKKASLNGSWLAFIRIKVHKWNLGVNHVDDKEGLMWKLCFNFEISWRS